MFQRNNNDFYTINLKIMKKTIYIISLIALAISFFLIIQYPGSGRMNMIAGGLATIGFVLNIIGSSLVKVRQTVI